METFLLLPPHIFQEFLIMFFCMFYKKYYVIIIVKFMTKHIIKNDNLIIFDIYKTMNILL